METTSRVKQLYGYSVCLISVVTFLLSGRSFLEAGINLSNPLQAQIPGTFGGPALSSFEAYVATYREPSGPAPAQPDTASVETLRARWEALRTDRIGHVRFASTRSMATSGLLILLSALFFVFHWRWLRHQGRAADAEAAA